MNPTSPVGVICATKFAPAWSSTPAEGSVSASVVRTKFALRSGRPSRGGLVGSAKLCVQLGTCGRSGKLREKTQSLGPGVAPSNAYVSTNCALPLGSTVARRSTVRPGVLKIVETPVYSTVPFWPLAGPGVAPVIAIGCPPLIDCKNDATLGVSPPGVIVIWPLAGASA